MAETSVVECPNCKKKFRIGSDKLGRTFKCTGCETRFVAGGEPPPPAVEMEPVEPPPLPESTPDYSPPPEPMIMQGVPGLQTKTSGMAIASLVCGIIGCLPICGLLALIFGIIGINQTKPAMAKGRGMAIGGTILGSFWILVWIVLVLISILLPSLNRAREFANRAKCASNMKMVGLALIQYQGTYQAYPPDLTTLWKTNPSLNGSEFVCPSSNDTPAATAADLETGGHCSYVFNAPMMPGDSNIPMLFEHDSDHMHNGTNILFGDGQVRWYPAAAAAGVLGNVKR